jgi:predicted TIM-barrel fold metal-dependent hydrolase
MIRPYQYISGDGHMEISPEQWRDWVDPKYRDRAPRAVNMPDGSTAILVENSPLKFREQHNPGVAPQDWSLEQHINIDEMPGGGPPEQRVEELNVDGMDAEILFPTTACSDWDNIADDDAYLAMWHGYNEWLSKRYCAVAPDRLLGLGVIPVRNINAAVSELEHCAKLGLNGVVLRAFPSGKNRVTAEDDRFWAAAIDLDMPVTVHSAFDVARGELLGRRICTYASKAGPIASFLAVYGVFDRFPKLKIYFAENLICWQPGWLESMDVMYKKFHHQYEKLEGIKPLDRLPSEIIREHTLWGFMDDQFGLDLRARYNHIPVEHAIWGHDFPHKPTDWPHSREQIERIFVNVPADEKYKMTCGNVIDFFHLEDAVNVPDSLARATADA